MVDPVTKSDAKKPSPAPEAFSSEDQKALQVALDNYMAQSIFNTLTRVYQQVNDEFKEPADY